MLLTLQWVSKHLAVSDAASLVPSSRSGCRSVGGMRASIYNAMPEEGVLKLVSFMKVCVASCCHGPLCWPGHAKVDAGTMQDFAASNQ